MTGAQPPAASQGAPSRGPTRRVAARNATRDGPRAYGDAMRHMPNLLVTCVVALVCGFLGALGAVTVFQDQITGPQGATGLRGIAGEPGPAGTAGADGIDGVDGERGPRGRPGRAARTPDEVPLNIGTSDCLGRSVQVVTDVTVRGDELELQRETVCVVE